MPEKKNYKNEVRLFLKKPVNIPFLNECPGGGCPACKPDQHQQQAVETFLSTYAIRPDGGASLTVGLTRSASEPEDRKENFVTKISFVPSCSDDGDVIVYTSGVAGVLRKASFGDGDDLGISPGEEAGKDVAVESKSGNVENEAKVPGEVSRTGGGFMRSMSAAERLRRHDSDAISKGFTLDKRESKEAVFDGSSFFPDIIILKDTEGKTAPPGFGNFGKDILISSKTEVAKDTCAEGDAAVAETVCVALDAKTKQAIPASGTGTAYDKSTSDRREKEKERSTDKIAKLVAIIGKEVEEERRRSSETREKGQRGSRTSSSASSDDDTKDADRKESKKKRRQKERGQQEVFEEECVAVKSTKKSSGRYGVADMGSTDFEHEAVFVPEDLGETTSASASSLDSDRTIEIIDEKTTEGLEETKAGTGSKVRKISGGTGDKRGPAFSVEAVGTDGTGCESSVGLTYGDLGDIVKELEECIEGITEQESIEEEESSETEEGVKEKQKIQFAVSLY